MSKLRVRCPQGHLLEVEVAHAGKQVQCPICKVVMSIPELPRARTVTASSPPAASRSKFQEEEDNTEEDLEEEERPKKLGNTKAGLRNVRTGLNYHIAQLYVSGIGSVLLVIFAIVALVIGMNAVFNGQALPANQARAVAAVQEDPGGLRYVPILAGIIVLASAVLSIICCVYLLAIPEKTRAKNLAIIYVAFGLSAALIGVVIFFLDSNSGFTKVLKLVEGFFVMVSYVCLMLLLKRLCFFLKKSKLAARVNGLFALMGVIVAGYFLIFLGSVAALGLLSLLGVCTIVAVGIWYFIAYLRFLYRVRDAIDVHVSGN